MSGKKLDCKDEAEDYRPPQTASAVEVVRGDESPGQPDGGVYLVDVSNLSSRYPLRPNVMAAPTAAGQTSLVAFRVNT